MCVLNGRVQGENDFTCIKPQGKSVVDYFITCLDDIKYVKHMYVKTVKDIMVDMSITPTCSMPDHSVLITDIHLSDYIIIKKEKSKEVQCVNKNMYSKQYKVDNLEKGLLAIYTIILWVCMTPK